jgi:hypothetical protein
MGRAFRHEVILRNANRRKLMTGVVLHRANPIVRQSQRCDFNFPGRGAIRERDLKPLGYSRYVGLLGRNDELVSFSALNLKYRFWFSSSPGLLLSHDALVFSAMAGGFSCLALFLFRAHFGFNFGSDARFQLGALAHFGFSPLAAFRFSLQACLNLRLPARFFFGGLAGCFLRLTANFFISTSLSFCFSLATSMFSRKPLRFLFRPHSRLLFCLPAQLFFGLAALFGFGPHLGFDLSS